MLSTNEQAMRIFHSIDTHCITGWKGAVTHQSLPPTITAGFDSVQTIPRSNIFGMDTIAKPISNICHGEFLQLAEEQEAESPLPQQDHSSNHS